jgi:hypothetical protein
MTRTLAALAVAATVLSASVSAGTARGATTQVFFAFHRSTNTSSWLTINKQDVYSGAMLSQRGFRAGSGTSTDECYVAHGWLPTGWYDIVGHYDHYDASLIKGRVWQLSDKRCLGGTGTLRTELFVHSEETADDGQYCPTPYDDSFCWEGAADYYSNGCIKLAHAQPYPSDVAIADNDWDAWDGRHGAFTSPTALFVS